MSAKSYEGRWPCAGYLYVLFREDLFKIGATTVSAEERLDQVNRKGAAGFHDWKLFMSGRYHLAFQLENCVQRALRRFLVVRDVNGHNPGREIFRCTRAEAIEGLEKGLAEQKQHEAQAESLRLEIEELRRKHPDQFP